MNSSKQLKRSWVLAVLAVIAVLLSITTATFAWYVFNTSARTTEVKMSAGSSVSLQIASKKDYQERENEKDGSGESAFGLSTQMEPMDNSLIAVSTDRITNGFQAVTGFRGEWEDKEYRSIARFFRKTTEMHEYYKTTLLLRTAAESLNVYLPEIAYNDRDGGNLSKAMRLGLVVKDENGQPVQQFIYELNEEANPDRIGDNGSQRPAGYHEDPDSHKYYALDSTKTDGTVVELDLKRDSDRVVICTLKGGADGGFGKPTEIDVYLWLEGCDEECTADLSGQTMDLVSLKFTGEEGGQNGQ